MGVIGGIGDMAYIGCDRCVGRVIGCVIGCVMSCIVCIVYRA